MQERPGFPPEDQLPPLLPLDPREVEFHAVRRLAAAVVLGAARDAIAGRSGALADIEDGLLDLWLAVLVDDVAAGRERLLARIAATRSARALQMPDAYGRRAAAAARGSGRPRADEVREEHAGLSAGQRALAAAGEPDVDAAAEAWRVNRNYVAAARQLLRSGAADLVARVQAGAVTFNAALAEVKARRRGGRGKKNSVEITEFSGSKSAATPAQARAALPAGAHPGRPGWYAGRRR